MKQLQQKFVSKLFVLTTFAMFGLMLNPTVFANDVVVDNIEINQYSNQEEFYLIQYKHQNSGQEILQVFTSKKKYEQRLNELKDSSVHSIIDEKMVRNGHVDMYLTDVVID